MSTTIIDLNLDSIPDSITGFEGYSRALVLIRINGAPSGQSVVPVVDGKVGNNYLKKALMEGANWSFWQYWLNNYLGIDDDKSKDPESLPAATVAVCTRDRTEDLRRCLESLINMPDDGQEIMVIDNCPSSDSTRCLVESFGRVRYVREDIPGLNSARNRALTEAKHPIVAFIDDDAVPDSKWLRVLLRNFEDPLALCTTGLTMPLELETESQEYFEREGGLGRGFWCITYDAADFNPQIAGTVGAGVNMALRKSILDLVGPFDVAMDAGTFTHAGGDAELFSRILSHGYRIVYDPEALNWHKHKRTRHELRHLMYGYRTGEFASWTRSFLFEFDLSTPESAWNWLTGFLPNLRKKPIDLYIFELLGCLVGPWAYLYSRWIHRKRINKR